MFTNTNITFIEVINNFMSSFTNLFGFLSGLNRRDFTVDILYLISKIQENVTKEEIEDLFKNKILPKMPDYLWDIEDFSIFGEELMKFFEDKKLDELLSDEVIKKPRNESEAKKFLKTTFKLGYSQISNTTSEQIALIKSEKIKQDDLNYLKISREFIQTLEFIKDSLESESKEINKIGFNERRLKSIMKNYAIITLLFLRMYSISYKIQLKKLDLAIKETDYLGMERTSLLIGG